MKTPQMIRNKWDTLETEMLNLQRTVVLRLVLRECDFGPSDDIKISR